MSYQVLARSGAEVLCYAGGAGARRPALTHASNSNVSTMRTFYRHARVGKTTLARIVAKALNCETGITATPCGTCSSCTEIDSGALVDYIELDAASNRGVEDMTSLLEKATYAPTRGRFKVYVIDEVHQLSARLQCHVEDAEEPPETSSSFWLPPTHRRFRSLC